MSEQALSGEDRPYSVKEFSERVATAIRKWPTAYVEGELVKFKPNYSGHVYPALKDLDGAASIELVIFANVINASTDTFADGDRVIVSGVMDYYVPNGKLSLKVSSIRKVGLGDLLERIERLRQLFISEGLTDPARKQSLPFLPNCIGLITGKDSDAEKDVLQNVSRRWSEAKFRVINTKVQGDSAAAEVIAAVKTLDADPEVDVIIIARGGGAFMDLVVFSDEALCRAVAACETPVVSAIGHEADSPLLDIVADLRASTPTDAAKHVVPDVALERSRIQEALARMLTRVSQFISTQSDLIAQLRSRPILANPFGFIDDQAVELDRERNAVRVAINLTLERAAAELSSQTQVLRSLSPQSTLDRGYSVVRDDKGHVIGDAAKLKAGQKLKIRLAKGEIDATVDKN